MTKLEERLNQLAGIYATGQYEVLEEIQCAEMDFKAGARAVLKMPELKELLAGLKFECGNRCADQNPCNAKETITKWRSFIGEVNNEKSK